MFQRITFYNLIGVVFLILLWGLLFVRVRPCDMDTCRKLHMENKAASSQAFLSKTHQQRKNVKKEIYFVQEDNSRLHYRICSRSSLLTVQPREIGKKIELNEKLEKIKCWMQDKLYYSSPGTAPMQQMRFFEAEEGFYSYTSQQFVAQSVALSLFRLPAHELPQELRSLPFLKGVAKDVSFAVSGRTPSFKAQHFKAELNHTVTERL